MGSNIQESLEEHLRQFTTLPFLFIGSGLSRRYIKLETWDSLLTKYSELIGKPFSFYRSLAHGDLALAGKLLSSDYHEYWYNHTDKAIISSYELELIDSSSPLKIEISKYLLEKSTEITQDKVLLEELELFKRANFDGIITANWDILLENLFPDFFVYIGQEELLNSTPQMIGEIYKIHGSCSSPNSLVLTSDDYNEFLKRNPYLIAKLLAIFIEHPIIFFGYSINDKDIRNILDNIFSCLSKENIKRMEKQFIFVEWDTEEKGDLIYNDFSTSGDNTIPITVIRTNNFSAVFRALSSLERKIPIRILRLIKEQLYEIVVTNDPKDKITVLLDINNDEDLKNASFVVGVGENTNIGKIGIQGITAEHLVRDLIFDDLYCDPRGIISLAWPSLGSHNKYIPLFKYLRKANYLSEDGKLDGKSLPSKVLKSALEVAENKEYFDKGYNNNNNNNNNNKRSNNKRREIQELNKSIPEMVEIYGASKMLYYIPLMERDKININELETYLRENYKLFECDSTSGIRSFYHKIICLYDWLRYGSLNGFSVIK